MNDPVAPEKPSILSVDGIVTRTRFRQWEILSSRSGSLWRKMTPPQLFVGSFLFLILLGTVGLKLLPGLYTSRPLSWLDALFTMTSAVCVTGLIVVDTATYFTPAGQAWILLFIQLGGLGIITFTSLIIIALGRRLSLRHEALSASTAEIAPHVDTRHLTRNVLLFTFLIEGIGAVLLWLLWGRRLGWADALWPAFFHSISAFCNAGFSTFSDNLIGFQRAPGTLVVIMCLIVIGGIGFLTLEELYLSRTARRQKRNFRLSLHSQIVLGTTLVLLVGGWVLFGFFEWAVTLRELPAGDRLLNALFMSVTARTAGFNAIDYGQASSSGNFLTILLMSAGGSPGSTAGGLKTTTVALIGLLAWSRYRGREVVNLRGRSVPEETIQRAVGLFVVMFGLVTAGIFLLTATESWGVPYRSLDGSFLPFMFEAASALNTVGLSMGVTAGMSVAGKWTLILLMFLGRVGPLTFAAALARPGPATGPRFRYAYEDVVIG